MELEIVGGLGAPGAPGERLSLQSIFMNACPAVSRHGFGHTAATYRNEDWSKLCMTCGGDGYMARDCRNPLNYAQSPLEGYTNSKMKIK